MLPTVVFLLYGQHLDSPWQNRDLAKQRLKNKIAALPADLAPHLVLTKVHIQNNGWGLTLFFLPVPEHLHGKMLETFQRWAGDGGQARLFSEEETSIQVVSDETFKFKRQKEEHDMGDLDRMTSIMHQCLQLQGKPVDDDKETAKCQRQTGRVVAQCVNRVQAYKEKSMKKKQRAAPRADLDLQSDSDA